MKQSFKGLGGIITAFTAFFNTLCQEMTLVVSCWSDEDEAQPSSHPQRPPPPHGKEIICSLISGS